MKIKSENLEGQSLIWAMCLALRHSPILAATGVSYRSDHGSWVYPRFTDDSELGALIVSECVSVERPGKGQKTPLWRAVTDSKVPKKEYIFYCPVAATAESLGVAVCRAIVMSRLGEMVEIPSDLIAHKSP